MTHPFNQHRHLTQGHKRADERLHAYAHGGAVAEKEAGEPHDENMPKVPKLKRGGETEGHKSRRRLDRGGRSGGKGKKSPHVMINIAPGGGGQDRPMPVPVPGPPSMPPPGPPPMMPPRPPMAGPPGMPPGGMPPGMPPPGAMPMRAAGGRVGRKVGGRAKRQMGGTLPAATAVPPMRPAVAPPAAGLARPVVPAGMGVVPPSAAMGLRNRGGRTKHAEGGAVKEAGEPHAEDEPKMPHLMAGARSALGRMARAKAEGGFKSERAAGD